MKRVNRTPAQRARIVRKVRKAIARGTPLKTAIEEAGINQSNWQAWKNDEMESGGRVHLAEPDVVVYSGKKTTPTGRTKGVSPDVGLVVGSPEQVAAFFRVLRGGK